VQGLLDLAGLPFVGSGVLGSAVGMDKDMQKRLFLQAKLPVGDFLAITRAAWEKSRGKVLSAVRKKFRFPVFVKPATLGSSVGMTKAHDAKELAAAMDLAAEFAQKSWSSAPSAAAKSKSPSWEMKTRKRRSPAKSCHT